MAYMNQVKKKKLAGGIKAVMPKGWKYTLSVRNHMALVCTIWAAPAADVEQIKGDNADVNEYWIREHYTGKLADTLEAIKDAMNVGNHDNSDIMTDYFDVGWYIDIEFGRWNKPLKRL